MTRTQTNAKLEKTRATMTPCGHSRGTGCYVESAKGAIMEDGISKISLESMIAD